MLHMTDQPELDLPPPPAVPRPFTDTVNAIVNEQSEDPHFLVDREEMLAAIADIDDAIEVLKTWRGLVEAEVLPLMPGKTGRDRLVVPYVGVFQKKRRAPKATWDHDGTAIAVIDTGHAAGAIRNLHDAARAIVATAGIGYWKKEKLKERGIDPDKFCETGDESFYIERLD